MCVYMCVFGMCRASAVPLHGLCFIAMKTSEGREPGGVNVGPPSSSG